MPRPLLASPTKFSGSSSGAKKHLPLTTTPPRHLLFTTTPPASPTKRPHKSSSYTPTTIHVSDVTIIARLLMNAPTLASPTDKAPSTAKPITKDLSAVKMAAVDLIEASKKLAAYTAVDQHVLPKHRIIGIGSGSTVPYVVDRIVEQGANLNKGRVFIPTGFQSRQLIVQAGLTLGDVEQYPTIDITIDGADEVDSKLNCVKGGGACHLREKVLAEAAQTFILVADYRKNVEVLGTNFLSGVPIEVVPFAYAKVLYTLHHVIGSPKAALRMAVKKAGPVVSDNGNFIIDAPFTNEQLADPVGILTRIKLLTGVVEVGLFCGMAKAAYFGNEDGSVTIKWDDGKVETVV